MKRKKAKITIIAFLILFLVAIFFTVNYLDWEKYQNKIYPGVSLGGINLSDYSLNTAKNLVQSKVQNLKNNGLVFRHENKQIILPISIASFDADLSYSLFNFNVNASVKKAFGDPQQRNFKQFLLAKFRLKPMVKLPIVYSLDETHLISLLRTDFPELNIAPQNAYFSVNLIKNNYKLKENQEKPGLTINYQDVFKQLNYNLAYLNNKPINLTTKSSYPNISQNDLSPLIPSVEKIIQQGDLTIFSNNPSTATSTQYWKIGPQQIVSWISINKNSAGKTDISLDINKISSYLKNHIAPQVNQSPVAPRFEIVHNKVVSWQKGRDGIELNLTKTAKQINQNFLAGTGSSKLIMDLVPENFNNQGKLDIKQDLGKGESSFAYSPPNRIHNIETGLKDLQGILIKPGEEFSLNQALGKINKDTGYLPELVIKNNETIPEYGGGLCQIATTIFRTALASGLPITMRQNHSYQVSYYKPAGTDATIYNPLPDLRFINNTGHYILIQGKIDGNNLSFDFWGTSDGRIATTSTPTVYNLVPPPPTKLISTTSLKPGEKKCTESSHKGADAFFDYTVSYPAGTTTTPEYKKRFYSHYEPWQAVCLIGTTASSTSATSSIPARVNSSSFTE